MLTEPSAQDVRTFNSTFQSGSFRVSRSLAPKHVGRKEILCARLSSRRPRRTATFVVVSCDSSRLSQPIVLLIWTARYLFA
jgi:hypothetical protein